MSGHKKRSLLGRTYNLSLRQIDRISVTHKAAQADDQHSTFLKNFGKFHVATLNEDVIPADKIVVKMLADIQDELQSMRRKLARGDTVDKRRTARARISSALTVWKKDHPDIELSPSLLDDDAFVTRMEDECDARRYFGSQADFRSVLGEMIEMRSSRSVNDFP